MPRETYATMNSSFFGDMLASIAERGRALLDRTRDHGGGQAARSESLADLCEELLSGRGEASGVALAGEILAQYAELTTGPRIAFFELLAHRFGHDTDAPQGRDCGVAGVAVRQDRRRRPCRRRAAPAGTAAPP